MLLRQNLGLFTQKFIKKMNKKNEIVFSVIWPTSSLFSVCHDGDFLILE